MDVLKYHVVSGRVLSTELYNGQAIPTLNGEMLYVEIVGGNVYIQNNDRSIRARVTTPDVLASNGVAHVIESVLVPAAPAVSATAISTTATMLPSEAQAAEDPTPAPEGISAGAVAGIIIGVAAILLLL